MDASTPRNSRRAPAFTLEIVEPDWTVQLITDERNRMVKEYPMGERLAVVRLAPKSFSPPLTQPR